MDRLRLLETVAGVLLLAGLGTQLVHGDLSDGYTNDEILYIGDGYRQIALGDHRLNPTQPPLGQRMAAWGLTGLSLHLPELHESEDVLLWCRRFVEENGPLRLLHRARVASLLVTLGLAVALWLWARALGGVHAGLLALALTAFHPSLLAHGHLATTDMPAALAMLLAIWAFWRWSLAPSVASALLVAVPLAIGVTTRLTAWLLIPSFALLLLFRRRSPEAARFRNLAVLVGITAVVVPVTVWVSYDLRHALGPAGSVAVPTGAQALLPAGYLEAFRFQLAHNLTGHPAYLLGQHSKTGWRYYFLVAFLVKNTPGFLLALVMAVALRLRKPAATAGAFVTSHLLVPAAVVFLAASAGQIQIGERYLLPIYPCLILFAALTLAPAAETRKGAAALAVLFVLHAAPTLAIAPRGSLTYFNVLAGGTDGAHRVLLDSNLDWGQDLPRLAAWMREQGIGQVQLGYHGVDDPDHYGIRHEDLPGWHLYPARPPAAAFRGTVAVSPNLLYGLLPRLGDPYASLRGRPPDDRAGVFFIYREK